MHRDVLFAQIMHKDALFVLIMHKDEMSAAYIHKNLVILFFVIVVWFEFSCHLLLHIHFQDHFEIDNNSLNHSCNFVLDKFL